MTGIIQNLNQPMVIYLHICKYTHTHKKKTIKLYTFLDVGNPKPDELTSTLQKTDKSL